MSADATLAAESVAGSASLARADNDARPVRFIGAHRLPLIDLTVAVAAQKSGLEVLHYDRYFERLGELLGVRTLWIAEPSA